MKISSVIQRRFIRVNKLIHSGWTLSWNSGLYKFPIGGRSLQRKMANQNLVTILFRYINRTAIALGVYSEHTPEPGYIRGIIWYKPSEFTSMTLFQWTFSTGRRKPYSFSRIHANMIHPRLASQQLTPFYCNLAAWNIDKSVPPACIVDGTWE